MKPFIIAAIAAALLAPAAQAAQATNHHEHHVKAGLYEQIANRCMYIVSTTTPESATTADMMIAAELCVKGAEYIITESEINDISQREALATDVEQAASQEEADHSQRLLDAYDSGRLIGTAFKKEPATGDY